MADLALDMNGNKTILKMGSIEKAIDLVNTMIFQAEDKVGVNGVNSVSNNNWTKMKFDDGNTYHARSWSIHYTGKRIVKYSATIKEA